MAKSLRFLGRIRDIFLKKITQSCITYPWIWLLVFSVATGFFAYHLPNIRLETDIAKMTTGAEDSVKAIENAARDFSFADPLYVILLGDMNELKTIQKLDEVARELREVKDIARVITPLDALYTQIVGLSIKNLPVAPGIPSTERELREFRERLILSQDGRNTISSSNDAALLQVYVRGGLGSRGKKAISDMIDLLDERWGKNNYHLTGELFLAYSADKSVLQDVITLFPISVLIVILIMYSSFRSIWGVIVPGSNVVMAIICTLGFMAWKNYPLTIVSAIIPVILVAMGSADGIHIFNKYREELGKDLSKKDAIFQTMRAMNLPVMITSLTTAAGFGALRLSDVIPVRDFGLFSAFGIIAAMLFALTGIPSILAIAPIPKVQKSRDRSYRGFIGETLYKLGVFIEKRGTLVVTISIIIFLICINGVFRLEVESNLARYFRSNSTVAKGIRAYEDRFGGSSRVIIVLDTGEPNGTIKSEFLTTLGELEEFVNSFELFTNTSSLVSKIREVFPYPLSPIIIDGIEKELGAGALRTYLSRDNRQKAAIHTFIRSAETSEISKTLFALEEGLKKRAPQGVDVTVAGLPRVIQFHMEKFSESQIKSLTWSASVVWAMVSLFFLSPFLGLLAMLPLFFTVVINFGIMGYAGIPLDAGTILIASISIGVGVDYSIHFLGRVISEMKTGCNIHEASLIATRTAGYAIIINAATLILGFGILFFSTFLTISVFGALMAFTMAISAITALTIIPGILGWVRKRR